MTVLVRFAPSPTGKLHLGNIKTAIINWLFAKNHGGKFMLRIDDTDHTRSKQEYIDAAEFDLSWLGLNWDVREQQSTRMARYDEVAEQLKKDGRLYPCYETEEELGLKRKMQLSAGKPPIYDRAALRLTEDQIKKFEEEGRKPHWRFKIVPGAIEWNDLVRGNMHFQGEHLSDPILIREDGVPIYTLASVTDDCDFKVTHILRGEDHIANTAVQVQLIEAIGGTVPVFGHFSRLTDAQGDKLSKRKGSMSIEDLRSDNIEPMAIHSLLARLGTADPVEPILTLNELASTFRMEAFSKGAAKFSFDELEMLNAKILHITEFKDAKDTLNALGLDKIDEAFWNTIRPNLNKITDAKEWWQICREPVSHNAGDDAEFLSQAADLLPESLDEQTWKTWTSALKDATGRKGKNLFMPLRLGLTGQEQGPELKNILPLIGYDRAVKRLRGETA